MPQLCEIFREDLPDAGKRLQVGDRIGPPAAVFGRIKHTQDVVLLGERNDLIIESVLDVTEFLVRTDFLAEGVHVVEEFLAVGGGHEEFPYQGGEH